MRHQYESKVTLTGSPGVIIQEIINQKLTNLTSDTHAQVSLTLDLNKVMLTCAMRRREVIAHLVWDLRDPIVSHYAKVSLHLDLIILHLLQYLTMTNRNAIVVLHQIALHESTLQLRCPITSPIVAAVINPQICLPYLISQRIPLLGCHEEILIQCELEIAQ